MVPGADAPIACRTDHPNQLTQCRTPADRACAFACSKTCRLISTRPTPHGQSSSEEQRWRHLHTREVWGDLVKHVRQAMLGSAPAQRMLKFTIHRRELGDSIIDTRKTINDSPRSFTDYALAVYRDRLPS